MAALSSADRREVWAEWMRENNAAVGVTKADLRAAIDALDVWLDANAATINAAIQLPARSALSAAQKARMLTHVIRQRFVKGA